MPLLVIAVLGKMFYPVPVLGGGLLCLGVPKNRAPMGPEILFSTSARSGGRFLEHESGVSTLLDSMRAVPELHHVQICRNLGIRLPSPDPRTQKNEAHILNLPGVTVELATPAEQTPQ